jgi:hypothetical protein
MTPIPPNDLPVLATLLNGEHSIVSYDHDEGVWFAWLNGANYYMASQEPISWEPLPRMSEADVLRIITDTILSTVNVKNALWPREADRPMNPFNNARTAFPEEQAQEAAKAVLDALKANGVKL